MRAGNGYQSDLHEFRLTDSGTALLTAYSPMLCNLSGLGGPANGALTDVFFLVCCRDDKTHLRLLARLARLLLRPDFLGEIRAAETPADALRAIRAAEAELLPAE